MKLEDRLFEAIKPPHGETRSDETWRSVVRRVRSIIVEEVLLPVYERWRDVDGEIGLGASGSIANVIAKMYGLLEESNDA